MAVYLCCRSALGYDSYTKEEQRGETSGKANAVQDIKLLCVSF